MSAPKMTRHEMKQDDLVTVLEKAGGYAKKNPTLVRNVGFGAAAVVVLAIIGYFFVTSRASAAQAMLNEAQERFRAPVLPAGTNPGGLSPSYATEAERDAAALDSFTKLTESYGRTSEGRLANYYKGTLLTKLGRDEEAKSALQAFLQSPASPLLASLARAQLAQVLQRTGDAAGAEKIYKDLSEATTGAYPKDWALFMLAETQGQLGKKEEAAANYQKIVTEFPSSAFIAQARERAKGA